VTSKAKAQTEPAERPCMTPRGLAELALREADARNDRRAVRLFHPETYAETDEAFLQAVEAAAQRLADEETPMTVDESQATADALTRLITRVHATSRELEPAITQLRNAAWPRNGCRIAEIRPPECRRLAAVLRQAAEAEDEPAAPGLLAIADELTAMAPVVR